jgi:hypothetical protein
MPYLCSETAEIGLSGIGNQNIRFFFSDLPNLIINTTIASNVVVPSILLYLKDYKKTEIRGSKADPPAACSASAARTCKERPPFPRHVRVRRRPPNSSLPLPPPPFPCAAALHLTQPY